MDETSAHGKADLKLHLDKTYLPVAQDPDAISSQAQGSHLHGPCPCVRLVIDIITSLFFLAGPLANFPLHAQAQSSAHASTLHEKGPFAPLGLYPSRRLLAVGTPQVHTACTH